MEKIVKTNPTDESNEISSYFLLSVKGEVVSGYFPGIDNIYCKYCFNCPSPDWVVVCGQEESCSQISKRGEEENYMNIWNLPIDLTFKSSNPYGWPCIVISVYGLDFFGNDIVRGYCSTHIPPIPGIHKRTLPAFVPQCSSLLHTFTSWFTGKRAEFVESKVVAQGEGRGVVKVNTQGFVKIKLGVMLKDFTKYGYKYN